MYALLPYAAVLVTGCAGAKATIAAPTSEVPISLSRGIPDDQGHTLVMGKDLQTVGRVDERYTRWTLFYGAIRTKKAIDISDDINSGVRTAGGEAVTELSVRSAHCALNWMWPLMWLPVWPGCIIVDVEGTVVRRPAAPAGPRPEDPAAAGGKP
jgi:hypothetical protein